MADINIDDRLMKRVKSFCDTNGEDMRKFVNDAVSRHLMAMMYGESLSDNVAKERGETEKNKKKEAAKEEEISETTDTDDVPKSDAVIEGSEETEVKPKRKKIIIKKKL